MRTPRLELLLSALCLGLAGTAAVGQGVFGAANSQAPTRVGFPEGPLAGTNIMGQMLGGGNPDTLQPIGPATSHKNGDFFSGVVAVPGVPHYQFAFVQLLAWDSTLWGADLSAVPADQLGQTDIVQVFLTTGVFPDNVYLPRFSQSAIVPIPEPAVGAFTLLGLATFCFRRFVHENSQA